MRIIAADEVETLEIMDLCCFSVSCIVKSWLNLLEIKIVNRFNTNKYRNYVNILVNMTPIKEAVGCSETSINIYQSARCNNPEYNNLPFK